MSKSPQYKLHLPSLRIRGFRGIGSLSIPRMGRVTLFAGRNGVGKTTVLDAIVLYAARGHLHALAKLVERRERRPEAGAGKGGGHSLDFNTLFHAGNSCAPEAIEIGPIENADTLRIQPQSRTESSPIAGSVVMEAITDDPVFGISHGAGEETLYTTQYNQGVASGAFPPPHPDYNDRPGFSTALRCESVGPESLTHRDLVRLWDRIVLTEHEERAISALNLVLDERVNRVAMLGGDRNGHGERRVAVRLKGRDRPVTLASLGDGAVRLFGLALALGNSVGGFLLIDEAENGIHHSVQSRVWEMVLRTAHRNGTQVLATTHSWDCVRGFAAAARALDYADGLLVRLERADGGIRAVEYTEEELATAAEQGIEVR